MVGKIGTGEGIRTLDPNLGKREFRCSLNALDRGPVRPVRGRTRRLGQSRIEQQRNPSGFLWTTAEAGDCNHEVTPEGAVVTSSGLGTSGYQHIADVRLTNYKVRLAP